VTKGFSIASLVVRPFQKVCGNCHVMDVIIYPMDGVHKLSFLCGSITTIDELVLLTIEVKWLKQWCI